jgi:hypothetical protein
MSVVEDALLQLPTTLLEGYPGIGSPDDILHGGVEGQIDQLHRGQVGDVLTFVQLGGTVWADILHGDRGQSRFAAVGANAARDWWEQVDQPAGRCGLACASGTQEEDSPDARVDGRKDESGLHLLLVHQGQ